MFILRVDLKNGLHLEFNYAEEEAAQNAVTDYQVADVEWSIADEHGRVSFVQKPEVAHVMLCNLEKDVRQQVALGFAVEKWKQDEAAAQQRAKMIVPAGRLVLPHGLERLRDN